MRIWEKIKVNDVVIHNGKKYVVEKIYKEENTTYGILRNLITGDSCIRPLYCCTLFKE